MATLVLTVVGNALGGPIGGTIGAIIGQQIDNRLFAPKPREGPRLGDLSIQTSSYGAAIPRLYGRTRVAGSVIWATDLIEERSKVSTGKGKPKQTVYSYSANFAVVLSARAIGGVGRIWADGKLLRGEAGDFKTETVFRLHTGGVDQTVDPMIAASEGAGNAPAYRGLAYAVFEDFQLADYGNRIPSLSFEVLADTGPIAVGAVLADASGGKLSATAPTVIDGIAVTGDSVRGVSESFAGVVPLLAVDGPSGLVVVEGTATGIAPLSDDLGASADGKRVARIEREKLPFDALPRRRTVSYYDVARDYQQGSQSLFRPDFGARERRIDFAASLTPERARALIERKTLTDAAARDRIKIALPWRYARAAPGEALSLPGVQGRWLIAETRLEGMTVRAELERLPDGAAGSTGAEPGRAVGEVDAEHGPTVLRIIELPWLGSGVATSPALYAVAAGSMAGWRRAALLQSNDDGASFEEIGATAPPAVMGSAVTVLAAGTAFGFDRVGAVEVDLLHAGMTVGPATEDALIGGANLAMLGDELIQFAVAEKIGPVRYRLSGLLRGRRGTEWAVSSHIVGEAFTLIESDALLPLVVPDGVASVTLTASGVGDAVAVSASAPVGGVSLRPPAPVKLRPTALANGDTRVEWVRRSRDGWRWADHVDAPLGEESEAYEVVVTPQPGASRIVTLNSPEWTYTAAERAADVGGGATSLSVDICQIGTRGRSKAASTSLSLV